LGREERGKEKHILSRFPPLQNSEEIKWLWQYGC